MKLGVLIGACVLAFIGLIALSGVTPGTVFSELYNSTWGSASNASRTIREMVPLIVAGLAVFVALKAGLFNIGVEGQFTIGALCCGAVALAVPGPIGIVLGILAGMLGGAVWALPAGLIKAYKGGHEVISTIMLNNIASGLSFALLAGPMKAPGQEGTTTPDLSSATQIPNLLTIGKFQLNAVTLLAVGAVIAFAWWLKRTVGGYELRLIGDNPRAAEFAGVDVKRSLVKAMSASGALGGLAGAFLVLAYEHRVYAGISSGYGYDALGVALLAGGNPLGIFASSLIFGMLNKGSSAIQILGIPKGITFIVLGLLIIVFAAVRYRRVAQASS